MPSETTRASGSFYGRVEDLSLTVEDYGFDGRERATLLGFERKTTLFELHGENRMGVGEDVTYDSDEHDALANWPPQLPTGEFTLRSFATALDEVDLFPGRSPFEAFRHYRRWGVESAALDLALKQAGLSLAEAVDRRYDPVRFVVSPRLGDPPSAEALHTWLDLDPDLKFKLDATEGWTLDLASDLAATDAVRVLDLKDRSGGQPVDEPPNADLYRLVFEAFPKAILEDPAVNDATRPILADARERLSWDGPITGIESIESLPFEPEWLNIKPARFGTVESLLDAIEYCLEHEIRLYGGGSFELDVGREYLHALASVFYPEGPNDIAPTGYNDPKPRADLPESPLSPPTEPEGLAWH